MTSSRDVITVDGLAASGKSAIAKGLAKRLGYGHLNSGLLYRAVAFLSLQERVAVTDAEGVLGVMSRHSIELAQDQERSSVVVLDGVVCGPELLSVEVSQGASQVARHQGVRDRLIDLQRNAFKPGGVVAEGRDMGTVIFPDARLKFFVGARLDVRAMRRYQQLKGSADQRSLAEVTTELSQRDLRDATSQVGTMKQADGAIVIDNSDQPLEDVINRIESLARSF
jgi:cytidylate kinase